MDERRFEAYLIGVKRDQETCFYISDMVYGVDFHFGMASFMCVKNRYGRLTDADVALPTWLWSTGPIDSMLFLKREEV